MERSLLRKWGMTRKAIVSAEWNNLCKWHNTQVSRDWSLDHNPHCRDIPNPLRSQLYLVLGKMSPEGTTRTRRLELHVCPWVPHISHVLGTPNHISQEIMELWGVFPSWICWKVLFYTANTSKNSRNWWLFDCRGCMLSSSGIQKKNAWYFH